MFLEYGYTVAAKYLSLAVYIYIILYLYIIYIHCTQTICYSNKIIILIKELNNK